MCVVESHTSSQAVGNTSSIALAPEPVLLLTLNLPKSPIPIVTNEDELVTAASVSNAMKKSTVKPLSNSPEAFTARSVSTPVPLPLLAPAPDSLPSADFQVIIVSPVTVTSEALAETATSDPANAERSFCISRITCCSFSKCF